VAFLSSFEDSSMFFNIFSLLLCISLLSVYSDIIWFSYPSSTFDKNSSNLLISEVQTESNTIKIYNEFVVKWRSLVLPTEDITIAIQSMEHSGSLDSQPNIAITSLIHHHPKEKLFSNLDIYNGIIQCAVHETICVPNVVTTLLEFEPISSPQLILTFHTATNTPYLLSTVTVLKALDFTPHVIGAVVGRFS
jgi:hypothetical protein